MYIKINLLLAMSLCAFNCVHLFGKDNFATDFDHVRGQSIQKAGRESIIAEYSKLIDTYSGDPRVAEAMFAMSASFIEWVNGIVSGNTANSPLKKSI